MAAPSTSSSGWPVVVAIAVVPMLGPAQQAGDRPLTETERIVHLLDRFAFGPTPAAIEQVPSQGIEAWLEARLVPGFEPNARLRARLAALDSLELDCARLIEGFRRAAGSAATPQQRNRLRNQPAGELRTAVLLRAVFADNQLAETVADFFRNHFNVCLQKDQIRLIAPDWERTLRAHSFGDFHALLSSTAHHPAMLLYLDNHLSRRPCTAAERR
jgi:hypothetical protein